MRGQERTFRTVQKDKMDGGKLSVASMLNSTAWDSLNPGMQVGSVLQEANSSCISDAARGKRRPSLVATRSSEVCYGAFHDVMAKITSRIVKSMDKMIPLDTTSLISFPIRLKDHEFVITSQNSSDFAILDTKTSFILSNVKDMSLIRFEAVIESSIFRKRGRGMRQPPKIFPVSVNIFGPKSAADDVGLKLESVAANLQHPRDLLPTIEYHNPHFLTFGDEDVDMRKYIGVGYKTSETFEQKVSKEIGNILESLTAVTTNGDFFQEARLSSKLTSALKDHQKDGLRFIHRQEHEQSVQQLSEQLRQNICTSKSQDEGQKLSGSPLGGIIADMMGLGKTLTMLAAVTHSLSDAQEFANFYKALNSDHTKRKRTKATLVVVSSVQLLESWRAEIENHFMEGALTFVLFHGQNRPRQTDDLASVDLVLTTYATLVADSKGQNLLAEMHWFRVVLDEAHSIRNPSSQQFKAAVALCSSRRWCLTGTPIQNRLQDLTSLAEFLQLAPFYKKGTFHREVIGRLAEGGTDFAKPLRTWLQAYCLRRTQETLRLPPSTMETVRLPLTADEQQLYDLILHDTRREIDSIVSKGGTVKCNALFRAMLKMRRLCNLGTYSSKGSTSSSQQLDMEEGCERCLTSDKDSQLLVDSFSSCPSCGRLIHPLSPSPGPVGSPASDVSAIPTDFKIGDFLTPHAPRICRSPSPFSGFSTKLTAVVQNVVSSGPETKSIVFSCWTTSLDLLSQLLTQSRINHVRVDGRVSYTERSKRLHAFKTNPGICVLLMTTETGALGLTLTVANRIHLVEPQWNPSVEEQAIGRALRMGQMREVTIVRYMMEKTVEQNIIDLQRKKKDLAKFTFDTRVGESVSETFEELKSLLELDAR